MPRIGGDERVAVSRSGRLLARARRYGFMDTPDVPAGARVVPGHGLDIDLFEMSYFLSREIVVPTPGQAMTRWREALFVAMSRNAGGVARSSACPTTA